MTRTVALLLLVTGCYDGLSTGDALADRPIPLGEAACDDAPRAWVLAPSNDVAGWLDEAGFDVYPLPLDRSPRELSGLVVLGSRASAMPEYQEYMQRHAQDLYGFVDQANVVLQLSQDPEVEASPPFLPTTHGATRGPAELSKVAVLRADHPLLAGLVREGQGMAWSEPLTTEAIVEQGGFEVVLAGSGDGSNAALVEGAYGQGRILLTSLALDRKPGEQPELDRIAGAVFDNLAGHVQNVCARKGEVVKPTPPPEPVPFTAGSSVIIALPDTQVYSLRMPGIFDSQTTWIARHAEDLDIRYVFGLGDIVNNNSKLEWQRARASMAQIDGVVPYSLAPGNHDYGPSGDAASRQTGLNEWFSYDELSRVPGFGGAFEANKLDNTFHLFEAGGRQWIALVLEWGPRDEVVAWANDVMTMHADRLGILVTHAYLNNNDLRYDHTDTEHPQDFNPHQYDTPGSMNDGEELWQKLVRRHRFVMTLNGHVLGDGSGYLASQTDLGNTCHQMLSNYQMDTMGGGGYLRILEILPDGRTVSVRSYSPLLDRYLMGADQQLAFVIDAE